MKTFFMTIAFAAACLLGVGIGRFSYSEELPEPQIPDAAPIAEVQASTDTMSVATVEVTQSILSSVVGVSTVAQDAESELFMVEETAMAQMGSGIILSEDGFILTNQHVVGNGKLPIHVTLADKTEASAHLMWADEALDLAIIKIRAKNLTPANIPENSNISVGEPVIAVGNPLSLQFERTVTAGIISAKNRTIAIEDTQGNIVYMEDLLQTDAAINAGNSGGPLINRRGEVIGVNTVKITAAEGLGFAVPIDVCLPVIRAFTQTGTFRSIDFGFSCYSREVTFYVTADDGMLITAVEKNSPAEAAGLKAQDILLSVNDEAPQTMAELRRLNFQTPIGSILSVTYKRDGVTYRTEMKIEESRISDASEHLEEQ